MINSDDYLKLSWLFYAHQLGIPPDRDRVIRILRYLNALGEESTLPYPTLTGGDYHLDYQILARLSIPEIKKMCDSQGYFAPICADDNFWNIVADYIFRVIPTTGTTSFNYFNF